MSDFASQVQRAPSGCGIQGCLFGAMALFAILLIVLLVIAFFRFQEPPQGLRMPGLIGYPLSAVGAQGQPCGPVWTKEHVLHA